MTEQTAGICVEVALIHHPVVNRNGEIIGSAVTNLDLHDIARAACTYGVNRYWVVTPFEEQQELARKIVGHWTEGYGGQVNSDRSNALSLIRICATIEEAIDRCTARYGERPLVLTTCAKVQDKTIEYNQVRSEIERGRSVLLLFGTAWGLAPEVMAMAEATLPPILGPVEFNHLSVRSAASITLDRLMGVQK